VARSFKANTIIALAIYGVLWLAIFAAWCHYYEKVPASALEVDKHFLLEEQYAKENGREILFAKGTKVTEDVKNALVVSMGAETLIPVTGHGDVVKIDFTLVLQILNFLLMIWILHGLLWKPIMGVLDARAAKIRADMDNARAGREEAERLRSEYERKLEDAKRERARIVGEGREAGKEERFRIIKQAEDDAQRIIERARKQGEQEIAEALETLKTYVVELGVTIASKIIQREIRDEDHRKMAEAMIAEIERGERPL